MFGMPSLKAIVLKIYMAIKAQAPERVIMYNVSFFVVSESEKQGGMRMID